MELSEFKEKYKSLKAQSDEAWKAAEPEREKYELALEPFHEANEQIEMLMDEHGVNLVSTCEGCSIPIFEGDKSTHTIDGIYLCKDCSPMASDSLKQMQESLEENDHEIWGYDTKHEMAVSIQKLQSKIAKDGDFNIAT